MRSTTSKWEQSWTRFNLLPTEPTEKKFAATCPMPTAARCTLPVPTALLQQGFLHQASHQLLLLPTPRARAYLCHAQAFLHSTMTQTIPSLPSSFTMSTPPSQVAQKALLKVRNLPLLLVPQVSKPTTPTMVSSASGPTRRTLLTKGKSELRTIVQVTEASHQEALLAMLAPTRWSPSTSSMRGVCISR